MTDFTATPETPPAAVAFKPASIWLRGAGLVYDLIAVVAIVMVVGMICQIATRGQLVQTGSHIVIDWWYRPLQYLVVTAYFVVSWRLGGQTLGMRPWRMYLRGGDDGPIRWRTAIVRVAVVSLPLVTLSLGQVLSAQWAMWIALAAWVVIFAASLFNRQRRALHDLAAGTRLVRMVVPKRRR